MLTQIVNEKKAALLLFIFLLNSIIGLGCTLHQTFQDLPDHHEHQNGFHTIVNKVNVYRSLNEKNNHPPSFQNEEDACCQNGTSRFNSLAKETPQGNRISFDAPQKIFFLVSHISSRLPVYCPGLKLVKRFPNGRPLGRCGQLSSVSRFDKLQ